MKIIRIDEKYEIRKSEQKEPWYFWAHRYGEPWRNLAGDGLILALFSKLEEMENKSKEKNG